MFVLQDPKEPYSILAISSLESIHKLVWLIQTQLEIIFTESPGLRVAISRNEFVEFPVHKGISQSAEEEFSLIKNKAHSNILLKSQPNIDYILKVSGANSPNRVKDVIAKVKKVPGVLAVIQLEVQKGKGFAAFDLV